MAQETVQVTAKVEAVETLAIGNELTGSPKAAHRSAIGDSVQLSTTTTPAVDRVWSDSHALAAATDTVSLTALTRTGLTDATLLGKRIRAMKLAAHADNTGNVTVAPAAVSGYAGFPTVVLGPGDVAVFYFPSNAKATVAAGGSVDISGTIGDSVDIVLGAG